MALCEKEGKHIFDRSPWHRIFAVDNLLDEKYDAKGLEDVLKQYFGEVPLSAAIKETLVTSYELEKRQPWFFARHKAQGQQGSDFQMRFIAKATSAAPTHFEPEELTTTRPHGGFVDGGVYANKPGDVRLRRGEGHLWSGRRGALVSLGTGQHTRPIHYAEAKGWGLAMWAKPILSVVFDGVSDTVDHQMEILCRSADDGDRRSTAFRPSSTSVATTWTTSRPRTSTP